MVVGEEQALPSSLQVFQLRETNPITGITDPNQIVHWLKDTVSKAKVVGSRPMMGKAVL